MKKSAFRVISFLLIAFLILGCGGSRSALKPSFSKPLKPPAKPLPPPLPRMGYTIQVGAFSKVQNAAKLTESLKKQGLDAYYFRYKGSIYKVRFGNFSNDADAREKAQSLKSAGVIDAFFVVNPGDYTIALQERYGSDYFRDRLVSTAESFLGVPYLWGGDNHEEGFDCSGLAMAVYRHNGLMLPRSSAEQFDSGVPVGVDRLKKGDLVFFAIDNKKVSHVGIFTGNGKFIHAPGRGKFICTNSISNSYFSKRYAGARTFLIQADRDTGDSQE